jgi:hypothetical protein
LKLIELCRAKSTSVKDIGIPQIDDQANVFQYCGVHDDAIRSLLVGKISDQATPETSLKTYIERKI